MSESEIEKTQMDKGQREGERHNSSTLPVIIAKSNVGLKLRSLEITTWAKIESHMINYLSHPGGRSLYHFYCVCNYFLNVWICAWSVKRSILWGHILVSIILFSFDTWYEHCFRIPSGYQPVCHFRSTLGQRTGLKPSLFHVLDAWHNTQRNRRLTCLLS